MEELICFVYAHICLENLIIYVRKINICFIDGNMFWKLIYLTLIALHKKDFFLKIQYIRQIDSFSNTKMRRRFLKHKCLHIQKQPPKLFCKKVFLEKIGKFTGKHLRQSLLFNKVVGLRPETLLTNRLWQWCFPWNFANFQEPIFHRTPLDVCMFQAILFQLLK